MDTAHISKKYAAVASALTTGGSAHFIEGIEAGSLSVAAGSGGAWSAPGLILTLFFFVFALLALVEILHGGLDGVVGVVLLLLTFVFHAFVVTLNLLGLESSVHEKIDHDVPRLVTWDLTHELLDLASQKPEHVGDGEAGLVVGGDGDINPVEWGVRVAKGNDWDVHVGSLGQSLVVQTGVANDHESGLEESLGELIGESTWDPLATHVVGTGVCGELKDGTLSVLTGRDNLQSIQYQLVICQTLKRDQIYMFFD